MDSIAGATYTYDANGNTLSKTDLSGTTSYTWDFENRLISVALPGTGGTVNFKYDPFGRRIQKSAGVAVTNYVYDGDNAIEELNATGAVTAQYTQGLGIDEPLVMYRAGSPFFYHADGLGSISALTDATGTPAAAYVYDSFGNTITVPGSVTNPFRYTGRELDSETGLYYYRARYYDPATGRFLSEDPVGFHSGMNFYSYVDNNPGLLVDPLGLAGSEGGPEHPTGRFRCTCNDDCATLSRKIETFRAVIAGHVAWDAAHQTSKHAKEIRDLQNGLENCIELHQRKCANKPPRVLVLAPSPQTVRNIVAGTVVLSTVLVVVRTLVIGLVFAF